MGSGFAIGIKVTGLVLAIAGGVAVVAGPADAAPPTCQGKTATMWKPSFVDGGTAYFFATEAKDIIVGTDGIDYVRGYGGNDLICALGGDDFLYGDAGDDRIFAGGGVDYVTGDAGDDALFGGAGNDELKGEQNIDECDGGKGTDTAPDDFGGCEATANVP